MLEQIIGILVLFFLAVFAVRTKLFSQPTYPKYLEKPEEKINEEAKAKVDGKSLSDLVDESNKRYGRTGDPEER